MDVAQTIFNGVLGFGAFCGIFILKMIFDRIADAKSSGIAAAQAVKTELASDIKSWHDDCHVIALEAKTLGVRSLDELNRHKLHVAESYVGLARMEKLEAAIFKKLDSIEEKLDRKMDK